MQKRLAAKKRKKHKKILIFLASLAPFCGKIILSL